jgi:hypothetical protein
MIIIWNGFEQPGAKLEGVIQQASGYCADHAADMSACDCEPHEIVSASGVVIHVNRKES